MAAWYGASHHSFVVSFPGHAAADFSLLTCRIKPFLDQGGATARHHGAPATGLCAGAPARHGRAHPTATMDQDSSHSIQTGTGPVFLGLDCPARGHRV